MSASGLLTIQVCSAEGLDIPAGASLPPAVLAAFESAEAQVSRVYHSAVLSDASKASAKRSIPLLGCCIRLTVECYAEATGGQQAG